MMSRALMARTAQISRLARVVLLAGVASAAAPANPTLGTRLGAQTHVVIISGLGGDPKYVQRFSSLAVQLSSALHTRFGIPEANIKWLGEDGTNASPRFSGQSTKVNIERTVNALASNAEPAAQIVFVLIGHGAGDGDENRLSIPGPDVTLRDFAALLNKFPTQRIAFLDLTSASGDAIGMLAGRNRVVITATKTSFERNESRFAEFFVAAMVGPGADADKDSRISLLEAFRFAAKETKRVYDTDSRIQTEHAQLEDMGAKQGTDDPNGRSGEGMFARRFFLDAGPAATRAANADPRLAALYTERFAIEEKVDDLKQKKTAMPADVYGRELEGLLVTLARKSKEIRTIEGGK